MTTTQNTNLKAGTTVKYDGRFQGIKSGVIEFREEIESYYKGSAPAIYYAVIGEDLMIPASDIIAVLA